MYYYIEAYILIFLTYTLWLAANQDWTGDLTLTMGALYLLSYRGNLIFINILQEKTRKSQIFLVLVWVSVFWLCWKVEFIKVKEEIT